MAKRARPIKPLNEPTEIQVRSDRHGVPVSLELPDPLPLTSGTRSRSKPNWKKVVQVEDMYEVDELWWRGPEQEIQRLYFDLRLENSRTLTVYHDLVNDRWFRQVG
jgi:hypothetical protein